jgi:hypothetical protein
MTTRPTNPDLALHAVRVSGWLAPDRLACWGVDQPGRVLTALAGDGLLRLVRTPRGEMYGLTAVGTEHATAWAAVWLSGLSGGERAGLAALLDCFEQVDPRLKSLITSWQGGAGGPVRAALSGLHDAARETIGLIAAVGPQWASYPDRLEGAVAQVAQGDNAYVASPLVESYHTVWHLLHRDLRLVSEGGTGDARSAGEAQSAAVGQALLPGSRGALPEG